MWFWISFILLGLVLYIPLGILIILFIFFPIAGFLNKKNNPAVFNFAMNGGMVVLFIAAILVHGGFFGWYDRAESPFGINVWVDRSVENDFYRREEKNGRIHLTVTDKNYSPHSPNFLESNGKIHFDVTNRAAENKHLDLTWTVELDGQKYQRNNLPTDSDSTLFGPGFSLKYGENIVKVTASNNLGYYTTSLVINRVRTEDICNEESNQKVSMCENILSAKESEAKKKQANADSGSSLNLSENSFWSR